MSNRISLTSYDSNLQNDTPQLVSLQDIEQVLLQLLSTKQGLNQLFHCQDRAFRMSSTSSFGKSSSSPSIVSSLPIQTFGQPPQPPLKGGPKSQMCIKSAYIQNGDIMVSKIAGGGTEHYGNSGSVLLFDPMSLRLKTVLCDQGLLTEVRTAVACVYASICLLGSINITRVTKLGIVGGGVQAIWQLRLFSASRIIMNDDDDDNDVIGVNDRDDVDCKSYLKCKTVVLKTTSRDTAEAFIRKMKMSDYPPDRQWNFEHYVSPEDGGRGFQDCQLIHTLTPSREPVLSKEDIKFDCDFLHITCVGADSPGKRELPSDIVIAANRLVCDSISQTKERGEFQSMDLWQSPRFVTSLIEFGDLLENSLSRSEISSTGLSIFDSSGLALQDLEMAQLISRHL